MLPETIHVPSFVTLHLPDGRIFDGVVSGNAGGCLQFMPPLYARNFYLPKCELEIIAFEEGASMPRYTMKLPNGTGNVLANEFFDEFAK